MQCGCLSFMMRKYVEKGKKTSRMKSATGVSMGTKRVERVGAEEAELAGMAFHLYYLVHGHGIAVDVRATRCLAAYHGLRGTEGVDQSILSDEACKHVDTDDGLGDEVAGVNDGDVELAVGYRRLAVLQRRCCRIERALQHTTRKAFSVSTRPLASIIYSSGHEADILVDGGFEIHHYAASLRRAQRSLTAASKPTPKVQKKGRPLAVP